MIQNHRGISLVEIIIILGVIVGVMFLAVPNYVTSIQETKQETDQASAAMIADVASRLIQMNEEFQDLNIVGLDLSQLGTESQAYKTDPLVNDFTEKLWVQLLETIPEPVYRQYPVAVENFILTIKSGREVEVYVGVGADVSEEMGVKIYPAVELDYGR